MLLQKSLIAYGEKTLLRLLLVGMPVPVLQQQQGRHKPLPRRVDRKDTELIEQHTMHVSASQGRTLSRTGSRGGVGDGEGGAEAAVLDFGARERHRFQSPPRHLLLQKLSHACPHSCSAAAGPDSGRGSRVNARTRTSMRGIRLYPHRVPLPLEL